MKQRPLNKVTENGQMFDLTSEIVSLEKIQQRI